MIQVSSPTCQHKSRAARPAVAALLGLLVVALTSGAIAPAHADSLTDDQSQVRQAIAAARERIAAGEGEVDTAAQKLSSAQERLTAARAMLSSVNQKWADAKARDADLAKALADARLRLGSATAAVTAGEADVTAQLGVVSEAVRSAYQQRGSLVGYSVALSAGSTAELSQRLQWSSTVFDASAAQLDRLRELQERLEAAQRQQQQLADQVAGQKAETERQLSATTALARSAGAATAEVAGLVRERAAAKREAQQDLEKDRATYRKLQAEDRKIAVAVKRRAELERKKRLAAEARKKAAAKKAGKKYVPPTEPNRGFIYPVNARPGSPFGMRYHPILHYWRMHRGQDFGASCGARLYAVADGRVASARRQGGFGNYTVLDVGFVKGKYVSVGYAHQSRMVVRAGQRVKRGQVIGYVGTTGLSTGCHLHFQVYVNGGVVNPMNYL